MMAVRVTKRSVGPVGSKGGIAENKHDLYGQDASEFVVFQEKEDSVLGLEAEAWRLLS